MTLISLSAHALQCVDLFLNRDLPDRRSVPSATENINSTLYPFVTKKNIEEIFRHNYSREDLNAFGAKAVVALLPGKPAEVYFFPTGEGLRSWNTHHVEAISVVLDDPTTQVYLTQLKYIQGYQLTAKEINGRWRITILDINSTLTHFHEWGPEFRPTPEQEKAMLDALIRNIDESLQRFPIPDID